MSFESSLIHTLAVLGQFVAWSVVVFFAVARPRRKRRGQEVATLSSDGPVMTFTNQVTS